MVQKSLKQFQKLFSKRKNLSKNVKENYRNYNTESVPQVIHVALTPQ